MTETMAAGQSATKTSATDGQLLAQFNRGSQPAFTQLVGRHLDWVYAAARRMVDDPHVAEDVAQTVFLILARKAASLERSESVGAWLFQVTRFTCLQALRSARRQRHHERKAAAMAQTSYVPEDAPGELAAVLDEAVSKLGVRDRAAVVMRFYERKSFAEMAAVMKVSEDGARKRLVRATDKLRDRLRRRGMTVESGALASWMGAHIAPAGPLASAKVAAGALAGTAKHVALAVGVLRGLRTTKWLKVGLPAVGLGGAAAIGLMWFLSGGPAKSARPAAIGRTPALVARPPAAPKDWRAERVDPPAGYPIADGWPLALPGAVAGTPAVADLAGDGRLAVIVPCESIHGGLALVHTKPTPSVLLYAFYADGAPVPGWPAELVSPAARAQRDAMRGRYVQSWCSSPTVCKDAAGQTRVLITTPYFLGIRAVDPAGKVRSYRGGSQWVNLPVADLDGDGVPDVIAAAALTNVDGGPVKGWPARSHPVGITSGFAPCIGDANGDGKLEVFHLMADEKENWPKVVGFDAAGNELPGWKHEVHNTTYVSFAPVMGDVSGDGRMEVIANTGDLYVWTADGQPAPGTHADGAVTGILKQDISNGLSSPTLADLDGDGKAEIIVFDPRARKLRAWHGDGRGLGPAADGVIATLPGRDDTSGRLSPFDLSACGVSVADLGGDGVMDLFVGTYWVKWDRKAGTSTVTEMVPGNPPMGGTQPTICDLDGDGKAEVVCGLADGRVFVYRTELEYRKEWAQWVTANGNFEHTGVWKRP